MSANDKTGDKLVASIRRTKAGAAKSKTVAKPTAKKASVKKAPVRKKAAARRRGSAKSEVAPVGRYQSSKRVWPD